MDSCHPRQDDRTDAIRTHQRRGAHGRDHIGFHADLPLVAKLDRARAELLDLSTHNRLLNVPRSSRAAKTIEVVDERSAEVFRLLVREGKAMTFLPGREDSGTEGETEEAPVSGAG